MENKIYTDLQKAAEDMSVWRTIRRDGRKPAKWTDYWRQSDVIGGLFPYCATREREL